jgi:cullin 1
LRILVELGFTENSSVPTNSNQITSPTLAVYKEYFETHFLQDTEQFYRLEAATFLVHNSVTEYLKKVAQRLDEEVHRVQSYLHPSTLAALIKKVEEVLIRDQLDTIYAEAKALLRDEKHSGRSTKTSSNRIKSFILLYFHRFGSSIQIGQSSTKCNS